MDHYKKASKKGYVIASPGIKRNTLIYGKATLMTEFLLERGADLPRHSHPQEQTGYLVSGHIMLTIDGAAYDVRPGDSWVVPADVEHGANILEDSLAVEIFSPVRADYLP